MDYFEKGLSFAESEDLKDSLSSFRDEFHIPKIDGKETIYLCGNSLGLQPKSTEKTIKEELNQWANLGVEGHFDGKNPWVSYHKQFANPLAKLVGSKPEEVVCMNALTVNLHLLFASFYQPNNKRTKILIEADCFPSDRYAVESQIRWHGLDPKDHLVEVESTNYELSTESIISQIQQVGDELALVWLGGVNYFSGEVLSIKEISEASHQNGAFVGFDLAHAIGNVELALSDWQVDFATWCSYKYLNSGPGGVSGIYINENHSSDPETFRLAGWWGTKEKKRFEMTRAFDPMPTAESWQMSNAPILSMAAHKASLEVFEQAGFKNLIAKSKKLTSYLNFLLNDLEIQNKLKIITPKNRACQLSVLVPNKGKTFIEELKNHGIILDWREPSDAHQNSGVMRVAPVPLYNSFVDVWKFVQVLSDLLK